MVNTHWLYYWLMHWLMHWFMHWLVLHMQSRYGFLARPAGNAKLLGDATPRQSLGAKGADLVAIHRNAGAAKFCATSARRCDSGFRSLGNQAAL